MQKQLLPVGFYDLLFDEAEKNHANINKAVDIFLSSGYRLIKTPLMEFGDNFSRSQNSKAFRATDVISGNNLVFRNDITPQISRLLDSRLSQEDLPLKLCYVGDVLCSKSDDLYADRQQTQVGVEIIGCDSQKSDFEVIEVALTTLKKLEVKNLFIEFSLPTFLEACLAEIDCDKAEELREAVMTKNLSAIRDLAGNKSEIINKIVTNNDGLEKLIEEISLNFQSVKISEQLEVAKNLLSFLKSNSSEIDIRFDLFGDHVSSYHSTVSFDIFCDGFSYPIARGGRYKIKSHDAVGATIYMNRLRKIGS